MKILVTGATGLIGKTLLPLLCTGSNEVRILSRRGQQLPGVQSFVWDPGAGTADETAFEDLDAIIHLAGESVGSGRWTEARKQRILQSRTRTTELLAACVKRSGKELSVFITASGSSYYGMVTRERPFAEDEAPGPGFLAEVSVAWEKAADLFAPLAGRVVKLRISVVLSPDGGALHKMAAPVKKGGMALVLGSGRQYMPWIHVQDLCGIVREALGNSRVQGAYNLAAPEQPLNRDFTRALASVLRRPVCPLHLPAVVLKAALGEQAALLLQGSPLLTDKIRSTGYVFRYPALIPALEDCLKKKH